MAYLVIYFRYFLFFSLITFFLYFLHYLLLYPFTLSNILMPTLYTTAGSYVSYFVRSSGITPRSVGRLIRPTTFSFGILIFGRFLVEDRETLSACLSLCLSHIRLSWCSCFGQSPLFTPFAPWPSVLEFVFLGGYPSRTGTFVGLSSKRTGGEASIGKWGRMVLGGLYTRL